MDQNRESQYTVPAPDENDPFNVTGEQGPYDDTDLPAALARDAALLATLARDLYDLHRRTSISLDKWASARAFVQRFYGPIEENGA